MPTTQGETLEAVFRELGRISAHLAERDRRDDERHAALERRHDGHDRRFAGIDARLDDGDKRFEVDDRRRAAEEAAEAAAEKQRKLAMRIGSAVLGLVWTVIVSLAAVGYQLVTHSKDIATWWTSTPKG